LVDIKITKKLDSFHSLDFPDFCKELEKQKVKFSLTQQDEWEDYFNERKKKIVVLIEEIKIVTSDIDQMVYELYRLTNNEIDIIKNLLDT